MSIGLGSYHWRGTAFTACDTDRSAFQCNFLWPARNWKTTLARIIANTTKAQFLSINAVLAGIKDIRDSIETAQKTLSLYGKGRFFLLMRYTDSTNPSRMLYFRMLKTGNYSIGATTENPYFEVNKALVSRSRVFS